MGDSRTAAELLVDMLIDWKVNLIFGLPGDGINGIVEALRTRQGQIRFVVARHEEAAAFMACAYAKWTGRLGCCLATTGPGGVHLLNGLYDAKFDRAPVLAITGLPYHDLLETSTQQDIDHSRLFQDVAEHSVVIAGAAQVAQAVSIACRTALTRRGVAHLAIPVDVQEQTLQEDEPSPRNKAGVTSVFAAAEVTPDPADVREAAQILNAGSGSPSSQVRVPPEHAISCWRLPIGWERQLRRRSSGKRSCRTITRWSLVASAIWGRGRRRKCSRTVTRC